MSTETIKNPDKRKRCLTICPSRERAGKCREMLDSFFKTSEESDIVVIVDYDDPQLEEYKKLDYPGLMLSIELNKQEMETNTTILINWEFHRRNDYEFYHIVNDDFVYRTEGWDKLFIDVLEEYGDGIAYGNDLYMKKGLPTAPFISGSIARKLGWLQMPTLIHLCGDMVWKYIGEKIKGLYYLDNVIIDHKHPFSKQHNVEKDETHLKTNSREMYTRDNEALRIWLREKADKDIAKLKKVFNQTKGGS